MERTSGNPLLSVLIPTYNGGGRTLKQVLDSFVEGILMCQVGDVELIVSDNASTDNTMNVVEDYLKHPFVHYSQNESNIGFARNIIKLTDELAHGIYGWVVGDDDYLVPDFLPRIVEALKEGTADLYSLGFEFVTPENAVIKNRGLNYIFTQCSYSYIMNNSMYGNTLGAYMSSSIVNLDAFRKVNKKEITNNFDSYPSIFPNAYVNATAFYNRPCAITRDVALLAVEHKKEWATNDNNYRILTQVFPSLFNYIVSLGVEKKCLVSAEKRIIYQGLLYGYKRILKGNKVDKYFASMWCQSFKYPLLRLKVFKSLLYSLTRYLRVHNC